MNTLSARTPVRASLVFASLTFGSLSLSGQQVRPADPIDALARYDKNRNGQLDPDERDAMAADERRAAAAPTTAAGAATSSEIVELSPFQVTAADDRGYFAANTLSGTRLNSKLEDIASSISVVTKQQMLDLAAVDINDVFLYEANTEGTGNFTSFEVDRNRGVNDTIQATPESSNRIRGIGAANIARGNFATLGSIPVDSYNTDAIEISRGPNSNIFGLGEAAGTVNMVPSEARLNRNSAQFTLRGDSYGGFRGSVDVNRVLIPQKLAVRASALYDDKGSIRKPAVDLTRRQQVAVTWTPFKTTKLRASVENFDNYARRANSTTPRDGVSEWLAAGRPTWDPVTFTAKLDGRSLGAFPFSTANDLTLPPGLFSQGTVMHDRGAMYIDGGEVRLWTPGRLSTTANPNQFGGNQRYIQTGTDINKFRSTSRILFTAPGISNRAIYDWTEINATAANFQKNEADVYRFEIEQFFINTPTHLLAANAGWYFEDFDRLNHAFLSSNSTIVMIDVNERLLDGTPNPFFLRPFIGAPEPTFRRDPRKNDNVRAQVAYQLDLSNREGWRRWIGRHRFSGYGETRRITSWQYQFREAVLSNHAWINPANRGSGSNLGRSYYKYYVGDNQGFNVDYSPPAVEGHSGSYNMYYRNGVTGQWINEPATFGETGITTSNRNRREVRSQGLVSQSFLWHDRIVATLGWRKDKNRSRTSSGAAIDPATGLLDYSPLARWGDWSERSGTTRTQGVVVRPLHNLPWLRGTAGTSRGGPLGELLGSLRVHYNTSDTFQPAATQYNLFGEELPNPSGEGRDYGVSFTALDGRVQLKVNRYKSDATNARAGDSGVIATRANRIDFGDDNFNLEDFAIGVLTARYQAQGVTPTPAQMKTEVAKFMGLPEDFIENVSGKSISETSDITSTGLEIELHVNPTRHWTMKFTGAKQQTIDTRLSPNIQRYVDQRLPVWTTIKDDAGNSWWTDTRASSFLAGDVLAPYRIAIANQGKPRSQVREWRMNALTSYDFAGLGSERGWLRNLTLGGSLRWEDQAAIGFLGKAPEPDGVIRELDPNKPVHDKARSYVDAFARYRFRLYNGKVRGNVQVNVRNLFEDGRLQVVGVNPDGAPFLFRIIDPRQVFLTTTFEL